MIINIIIYNFYYISYNIVYSIFNFIIKKELYKSILRKLFKISFIKEMKFKITYNLII